MRRNILNPLSSGKIFSNCINTYNITPNNIPDSEEKIYLKRNTSHEKGRYQKFNKRKKNV